MSSLEMKSSCSRSRTIPDKDYRAALQVLEDNPKSISAGRDRNDVERFFRSRWFSALTEIDSEMLIRKLKEESV